MTVLLQATALTLGIADRALVNDLELTIRTGERWAVLGPNGSGKTTLLHTLAGLRAVQHGEVGWRGQALSGIPRRRLSCQLGLLLQDDPTSFPATVLESVLTGRFPHLGPFGWESNSDLQLAEQALADVDLAGLSGRDVASLSGGERRRLAIATLLAQAPTLALLDEPTNHLDLRHQTQLMSLLGARFGDAEHALLAVLHDPTLALRHCSHALLLPGNGSWHAGQADHMLTAQRLSELYGQPLQLVQQDGLRAFVPGAGD